MELCNTWVQIVHFILRQFLTAKRRYVEQELRRICPGYQKTSYKAEELVMDIDRAVDNEKKFCEDVVNLEKSIGSNVGKLIMEMRAQGV